MDIKRSPENEACTEKHTDNELKERIGGYIVEFLFLNANFNGKSSV